MDTRTPTTIRVATYNVHRCRGMDRRVSAERIAEVVERLNADVVAVQEIRRGDREVSAEADQARFLADALGYHLAFGENKLLRGAPYGNAIFSRLPIVFHENYDLTVRGQERRGCLRSDVRTPHGTRLHVYNVHLSTRYFARPRQARRLLSTEIVNHPAVRGPRIVVGDFNEWTRGIATRLMGAHFESVDVRLLGRRRTYPGFFPVLHLDQFYFDSALRLRSFRLHRSKLALVASDHLPLVAEFELRARADP
jgi:endonuclease/exonuclease/phosphatase family metal-dependent hydrolase